MALGQTVQIRGTVISSDDGLGIPGVMINVKGTTIGVSTAVDGSYSINVPAGNNILIFSFVGMRKQEIDITGKTVVDVTMTAETQNMDEVVVVAYGTAKKASITGAVSAVDSKDIKNRSVSSVTGILEGSTTGIQVNNTYGEPGSDPVIRVRGFTTINGSNAPLYVVDGVPYTGNISDLNPQDIASMTVLKDASSAALYGTRASNGVILITTKKGKDGSLNVSANLNYGVYDRGIGEYKRMGCDQWMETMWTGYKNYAVSNLGYTEADAATYTNNHLVTDIIRRNIYNMADNALFDANGKLVAGAKVLPGYNDLNWLKYLQRSGARQDYTLSADASNDKYNFFSSIGYLDEQGYITTSDFKRYTGRINANVTPKKWLKTGFNLGATSSESNYASSATGSYYANPFYATRYTAPVYPVYLHNADGTYALDSNGDKQYDFVSPYLSGRHLIYELNNNLSKNFHTNLKAQVYATITFLKDFDFTVTGDRSILYDTYKNYDNPVIGDGAGNNGRLFMTYYRYNTTTLQQQLNWNKNFEKHHIDVLLAHESYDYGYSYNYTGFTGIKVAGIIENSNFSNFTTQEGYSVSYRTESYLSRARYNFNEKYYFDAYFRRDGTSRIDVSGRWGNFFGFGGTWEISSEDFMKQFKWVNNLKLRAAYGEVANDAGSGNYGYMALYTIDQNANQGAYYQTNLANPDLKWETAATYDVALEGRLLDRLNFSFDYFDKQSRNLLFDVILPLSNGATGPYQNGATITKNIGAISNRGLEIALDYNLISKKDLKWNIGINGTLLRNKVLSLPDGNDIISGTRKYSEGHSIYEFWTYKFAGVDKMTGDALYKINYTTYCVTPESAEDTRAVIPSQWVRDINGEYYTINTTYGVRDWSGSAIPKWYGNLTNNITYKNFFMSAILTYSLGGKVYDSAYQSLMSVSTTPAALHVDLAKAWSGVPDGITATSPNRIDKHGVPRTDMYYNTYFNTNSDRWLVDASYLVIKNITFGYTIPKQITNKIDIQSIMLKASIENLATFTSRRGLNPQYNFSGGSDNTFVTARVFSVGADIKF